MVFEVVATPAVIYAKIGISKGGNRDESNRYCGRI